MKKIGVIQSNYIPWKGYFDFISRVDEFYLYDCVQYTPRNWRNRNCIKTKDGLQWLTIPVSHSERREKISSKTISDTAWNIRHWDTIRHNYCRAPFFQHYQQQIKELYMQRDERHLSQVNMAMLNGIKNLLGITTPLVLAETHPITGDKNGDLIALCLKAKADMYLTGPNTKVYFDEAQFNAAGIAVEWMEYDYPPYRQLHQPFEHKVSILDLLFNEGPNSINFLKQI